MDDLTKTLVDSLRENMDVTMKGDQTICFVGRDVLRIAIGEIERLQSRIDHLNAFIDGLGPSITSLEEQMEKVAAANRRVAAALNVEINHG